MTISMATIVPVIIAVIPVIMIAVVVTIAIVVPAVAPDVAVMIVAVPAPLIVVDVVAAPALVHDHLPEDGATERPAIEPLPVGIHGNHPIAAPSPPAPRPLHALNDDDLCAHHSAGAIREWGIGLTALHDHGPLHGRLRREWRCHQNDRETGTPAHRDTALHSGL